MDEDIKLTPELVQKYEVKGSFYTDYPPSGLWLKSYTDKDYITALKGLTEKTEKPPLILYVHFPFCKVQCLYCQCYMLITHDTAKIRYFLEHLYKEIDLLVEFFRHHSYQPLIKEIHLGGGSPSYMDKQEFDGLIDNLKKLADIEKLDEFTIEIDPRTVDEDMMHYYADKGINRISFGAQEFDLDVQKAVNRVQPAEMIEKLMKPEIRRKFKSVNFDLIYGMPKSTRQTFKDTINTTLKLSPDRIALCVLGYRPDVFTYQRALKQSDLPDPYERTLMNKDAIQTLEQNEYVRIGLDHFAKSSDDNAIAMKEKRLHRSPLGYTPGRCKDMIAIGPSGMSRINNYYFQNIYSLEEYYVAIDEDRFPILRGYKLSNDQVIRREVMYQILSYFNLNYVEFGKRFNIDFKEYFRYEIERLKEFLKEDLIELKDDGIYVTPTGKFFLRHIVQVFDNLDMSYLHSREESEAIPGTRGAIVPPLRSSV